MRAFQGTFAVDIWSIKCCVVDIWSIFVCFFGGRYSIKPQWPAWNCVRMHIARIISGTTKVRKSGLGPDPDLSAKSGPE